LELDEFRLQVVKEPHPRWFRLRQELEPNSVARGRTSEGFKKPWKGRLIFDLREPILVYVPEKPKVHGLQRLERLELNRESDLHHRRRLKIWKFGGSLLHQSSSNRATYRRESGEA
ncbi:MAG: hypothetical protein ACREER_09930, partial [Alphaproteobacteria bacterium]